MDRPFRIRTLPTFALAALALFAGVSTAAAHSSKTGGATVEQPDVTGLTCGTGEQESCQRGQVLRVSGENLATTRQVVFLGRRGPRDDRTARPMQASPHRVIVQVPSAAHSGPLRVVVAAARATATGPSLRVLPPSKPVAAAPTAPPTPVVGGVFPVQGKHDYGTEVNWFGGGRNHQGHDVFAACGTPLVAALPGTVTLARFQERAGNYVVIKADDATSQVYMHMLAPATVRKGDRVAAGQGIGQVGQTGRARGCHVHFELWTAPGWYEGGSAIDPLPALQGWDTQR